ISPNVPTFRPLYVDPSASQQSSTSHRLYFLQNAEIASRLKTFPSVCAIITAFIFGLYAASSFVTSISYPGTDTSTNTGTSRFWKIGFTVVGKPAATVSTSSPGFSARTPSFGEVSALSATRFALDPEFTRLADRTPINRASLRSNSFANRPVVNHPSSAESTTEHISAASITLPDTGTVDVPATNSRAANFAA